jgi:hypothetical protein
VELGDNGSEGNKEEGVLKRGKIEEKGEMKRRGNGK